jgi:hypothetical protein
MTILEEVQAACSASQLAARDLTVITAAVNAANGGRHVIQSRMITARAILAELGPAMGAGVLDKLEAFSLTNNPGASAVKWAVRFLAQDGGLDVGNAATQGMLDQLSGSVLTAPEVTALKAMARVSTPLTEHEVEVACKTDTGEWLI